MDVVLQPESVQILLDLGGHFFLVQVREVGRIGRRVPEDFQSQLFVLGVDWDGLREDDGLVNEVGAILGTFFKKGFLFG